MKMKTAGTCRESLLEMVVQEQALILNHCSAWRSSMVSVSLISNRQHVLESVILGECNAPALANVSPVNTAAIKFQEKFTEPRFKAKKSVIAV